MKKIINICLFLALLLTSCQTKKIVKTFENVSPFESMIYPNGPPVIDRIMDEGTTQRFNFYFMEGNRFKALGEYSKAVDYYNEAINADPASAACFYELANMYYMLGDTKRSEDTALKAVQLVPDNEWYLLFLSRIYHYNNKIFSALIVAKELVRLKPNNYEYLYNLSQMEITSGKYQDAIVSLNRIEAILGINEIISLEKHTLYVELNDSKNAENEIIKLSKHNPYDYDYQVYLGDYYSQQGNLKKALNVYEKVLQQDPNNGIVHFSLANYHLVKNDEKNFKQSMINGFNSPTVTLEDKLQRLLVFLMAIDNPENPMKKEDFENIFAQLKILHKDDFRTYVLYGNFLNHYQQRKEAAEAFETALLIDEKQESVWQDFLFLAMGEYEEDKFLEQCQIAANAFPENPIINFITALAYSTFKNYEKAIEHLLIVLEHNEDNARLTEQTYGLLGDVYFQSGDKEKAFQYYDKALSIDPNSIMILNNYAYYLSLENKELDKAERMISKVIEFEPFNPTYLDTYAWVLFKRGRYFEAIFVMEQAINNSEEPSGVLFEHYGDILYKNGDIEKALEYWMKAAEQGDSEDSEKLNSKINNASFID
ncbi:MAG: tetratricopeptide repeat protein [Marinilabiliaceae bacterium]|nr:tetratricopeptide repeat protein [Marinilabiliaceae bacterium]